jgi:hypothetical protein
LISMEMREFFGSLCARVKVSVNNDRKQAS